MSDAQLHVSPLPFLSQPMLFRRGPAVNGEFVVMPTHTDMENSDLDSIVSGTREAVAMIEGFARELTEEVIGDAVVWRTATSFASSISSRNCARGRIRNERTAAGVTAEPLVAIFADKYLDHLKTVQAHQDETGRYAKVDELKCN